MTVTTLFARRIQRPDFKSPSDIVALFVQPPRISRIYRLLDPLGFTSSEGGVRILNGTSHHYVRHLPQLVRKQMTGTCTGDG